MFVMTEKSSSTLSAMLRARVRPEELAEIRTVAAARGTTPSAIARAGALAYARRLAGIAAKRQPGAVASGCR
jgi:hypothetical protein